MSPFRGPRPVRETAGGQSAVTSGPAPAHRRPTRQRPGRRLSSPILGAALAQLPELAHRKKMLTLLTMTKDIDDGEAAAVAKLVPS